MLWEPKVSQQLTQLSGPKSGRAMAKMRIEPKLYEDTVVHFLPKFEDNIWSLFVFYNINHCLIGDDGSESRPVFVTLVHPIELTKL